MTSLSEENSIGEQAWREVLSKERISNDAFYNTVLKESGTYLSRVAERPDFRWEFRVLENPEVNAFCLPGGKVAVYTGLFGFCSNEAELSAVVGHEIGHAIARHGGERMTQQLIQQAGAEIVKASLGASGKTEAWLTAYAGVSNVGIILPYSRVHEYEADRIGMILMAKAGYDPNAALSFWEKMSAKENSVSALMEFLSTHPISSNRIAEMKKVLPEAQKFYQSAPVKRGTGRNIGK
ncbi:MAG TPA: M48 family metallopeptidase [Victivallales bacterium]|nr:M48 family metallopeptidase [Victivallales bacterium]